MACLNEGGKVFSERQRLMRVVMGRRRASRHCFRRKVGRMSREQEALELERMIERISSGEVGRKEERGGELESGWISGERLEGGIEE
jgi:hypothetical protein